MTDKELRRLSRTDLLEMLLEQSKEVERLQQELAEARQQLEERRIMTEEAGSIAEAALRINRVFEAAQAAADQNPQTVRRMKAFRNEKKDKQRNHVHAYSNPAGGGIKQNKIQTQIPPDTEKHPWNPDHCGSNGSPDRRTPASGTSDLWQFHVPHYPGGTDRSFRKRSRFHPGRCDRLLLQ